LVTALRIRKFARTRLTLARALAKALAMQPLSEVPVKALCEQAEVSEATFFNYFPRKQDLMAYLAHLWLLELSWHIQSAADGNQGLVAIDRLFSQTAKSCEAAPGVFRELLVWMARGGTLEQPIEFSAVEKQLAFPDLAGIEHIPVKGVDGWLATQLESAIAAGELPDNALVPSLLASLLTILLGVPLLLLSSDPRKIAGLYRQQLATLWTGVRAAAQRS
jgi:AcrR family transcriptional regulator